MTAEEMAALARQTVETALKEQRDADAASAAAASARQAEVDAAVQQALNVQAKEFAKARRLPDRDVDTRQITPGAPYVTQFADTRRYDNLGVEDMAFLAGVLDAAKRDSKSQYGISRSALKALAIKVAEDKGSMGEEARRDLKAAGLDPQDVVHATKANELDYSTQAGYGDEWVGVEYSRRLWERIRFMAPVASRIPTIEVPQGTESVLIPLEAADPTWYKVAQTTGNNATTGIPDSTVTASKLATDNKSLTVGKTGARVVWAEELNEDSLIPWISQLRQQLERSGGENLDALVIDGDTDAAATTNINYIDGTPGGTENYLVLNGFRKLALITNTANKRSASGTIADTDFLETIKLMGIAGLNAADARAVSFLIDANINWKIMTLTSVKTRDVFLNATLENGMLKGVWGYEVLNAPFMHAAYALASSPRKVNTAGKVDQSSSGANNTTGAILAVRWDQWLFGYKRRMTIKIQDIINSDASQIVATARVGLAYRDTEASAITYNAAI
jgi:hypothetical protein